MSCPYLEKERRHIVVPLARLSGFDSLDNFFHATSHAISRVGEPGGGKQAVVKTYPLFRIIGQVVFCMHDVLTLHKSQEGW